MDAKSQNISSMKTKHGDPTDCSCKHSRSSAWGRTGAVNIANPNSTVGKTISFEIEIQK